MASSLAALAQLVDGRLIGDEKLPITGAATLQAAVPGELTFIDSREKLACLARSKASAVLVPLDVVPRGLPAIAVQDVHRAFATLVSHFRPSRNSRRLGISPAAQVSPTARLGVDVDVHAGAFVGDDVEIGDRVTVHSGVRILAGCKLAVGVTIYPNAVLYEDTRVGARTVVHAGVVLGACGFGYKLVEGRHQLSAQLGYVDIGADVEIGANSTIDRGTYGPTTIGEGTKIDNLVMIGHNCQIGRHNLLCSQVGIAGSTTTGDYVVMGGQVGVKDHVHVGDSVMIGAQSGIGQDVPAGMQVAGSPAVSVREHLVQVNMLTRLRNMSRELRRLRSEVDGLTQSPRSDDSAAA